jgi:hypothetical protein
MAKLGDLKHTCVWTSVAVPQTRITVPTVLVSINADHPALGKLSYLRNQYLGALRRVTVQSPDIAFRDLGPIVGVTQERDMASA